MKKKKKVIKRKKIVKKKVAHKKVQPNVVAMISDEISDLFDKFSKNKWSDYLRLPTEKDLKELQKNLKQLEKWMKKQMKCKCK